MPVIVSDTLCRMTAHQQSMLLEENALDYRQKLRLYHHDRYMQLREHDRDGLERAEVHKVNDYYRC